MNGPSINSGQRKLLTRLALLAMALLGLWALWPGEASPTRADIVKRTRLSITTTGADGSGAGTATTEEVIQGRIVRVDIDYASPLSNTTDLTLADTTDLIATNIVNRANGVTDATVYPTVGLTDNTGTAVTYDGTHPVVDYYPIAGKVTATLAETIAATPAVTIDIYWLEDK